MVFDKSHMKNIVKISMALVMTYTATLWTD